MSKWVGKWEGGRVSEDRKGRQRWVIDRQVNGRPFRITLKARSEQEARAQLARFDEDPRGFDSTVRRGKAEASGAVTVDPERVEDYLKWQAEQGRSAKYRKNLLVYLRWWDLKLQGQDLRSVTLADLQNKLRGETARKHRIIALKSFASWLRQVTGELPRAQDPTLDLVVPPPVAEKTRRTKGYQLREIEQLYRAIEDQGVRDVILIQTKLGCHFTEVVRMADIKATQVTEFRDQGEIAGTVVFRHKRGDDHTCSVDAQTLAAIRRLRARGAPPDQTTIYWAIRETCEAHKGWPEITQGELRHTLATQGPVVGQSVRPVTGGAPLADVAEVLGHRDARTTRTFYRGATVPVMVVLPIKLEHPADPIGLEKRRRPRGSTCAPSNPVRT